MIGANGAWSARRNRDNDDYESVVTACAANDGAMIPMRGIVYARPYLPRCRPGLCCGAWHAIVCLPSLMDHNLLTNSNRKRQPEVASF